MTEKNGSMPGIVLVHGAFVDGSGWKGVYRALRKEGYAVSIVQNPTTTLAEDVAATRRVIDDQGGPVILVGHSYGGAVITEAGNHPSVVGLVYIAAFAPDKGESVAALLNNPTPGVPAPPILPPRDGFLTLDKSKFREAFAADLTEDSATFMAVSQVAWGTAAAEEKITSPAWREKPSWYMVATADRMIPPAAQRVMANRAGATIEEDAGSHAIYVSRPENVAALIVKAALQATVGAT